MTPRRVPLVGIEQEIKTLRSYSGLREATAFVLVPRDEDELSEIFDYAQRAGRRITLRGGGHAFDDQSLGQDLVVSMERFDAIVVHPHPREPRVTIGAGARWGRIVGELARHGLVMPGTVTTARATAGGTLASDCLSRFSPLLGKEGSRVESFRLMTPNGIARTYSCPAAGSDTTSLPERTFLGAINGFGYLGALVEITYRVAQAGGPTVRVRTNLDRYRDFSRLASTLVPSWPSRLRRATDPHALWAGLYPGGLTDRSALVLDSSFTTDRKGRPFPMFAKDRLWRRVGELLIRDRHLYNLISRIVLEQTQDRRTFVDDLDDFMFFMDANTRVREAFAKVRAKLPEVQQTFFLPAGDQPQVRLEAWLQQAEAPMRDRRLTPIMVDVGYLPKDVHPFYLSPSAHSDGFAISYAFATKPGTRDREEAALWEMSEILWRTLGGRVSLVKNVHADPRTLARMYQGDVRRFFQLKRQLDPCCVLRNDFLERAFPDYCRAAGCSL